MLTDEEKCIIKKLKDNGKTFSELKEYWKILELNKIDILNKPKIELEANKFLGKIVKTKRSDIYLLVKKLSVEIVNNNGCLILTGTKLSLVLEENFINIHKDTSIHYSLDENKCCGGSLHLSIINGKVEWDSIIIVDPDEFKSIISQTKNTLYSFINSLGKDFYEIET